MPYKILKHTADIRILAQGDSLEEPFSRALMALMDILKPLVAYNYRESYEKIILKV